MEISCPDCKEKYEVDDNCAGEKAECLKCHKTFVVPPIKNNRGHGALYGCIACLVTGIIINSTSLYLFLVWVPLYLAVFVLAIVSIAQRRVLIGIIALIASVLAPITVSVARYFIPIVISMNADQPSENTPPGKIVPQKSEENTPKPAKLTPQKSEENKPKLAKLAPRGAFGIKFGDIYTPPYSKHNVAKLTTGEIGYLIGAPKKFRKFEDVTLLITPKTHKIYEIRSRVELKEGEREAEKEIVLGLLSKKYKMDPEGVYRNFFDFETSSIYLPVYLYYFLEIRYTDKKLAELAKKERLEIESKKSDNSAI